MAEVVRNSLQQLPLPNLDSDSQKSVFFFFFVLNFCIRGDGALGIDVNIVNRLREEEQYRKQRPRERRPMDVFKN